MTNTRYNEQNKAQCAAGKGKYYPLKLSLYTKLNLYTYVGLCHVGHCHVGHYTLDLIMFFVSKLALPMTRYQENSRCLETSLIDTGTIPSIRL